MNLEGVRGSSSFVVVSGRRVLIRLVLAGGLVVGRLVTWELAALLKGGLLRAMVGWCIRELLS